MPVSDYSETASNNGTIEGINISENCSPSGLNDAMRQMMADTKVESDRVTSTYLEPFATVALLTASTTSFADDTILSVAGINIKADSTATADYTNAAGIKFIEIGPIFSTREAMARESIREQWPEGFEVSADGLPYVVRSGGAALDDLGGIDIAASGDEWLEHYGCVADGSSGAVVGVGTDNTANMTRAIANAKGRLSARVGTYRVTGVLPQMPENLLLFGVWMGSTVIDIREVSAGNVIETNHYGGVENITFLGDLLPTDITAPAVPYFSTIDEVVAFNQIGNVNAIRRNGTGSKVRNCEFLGINGWSIISAVTTGDTGPAGDIVGNRGHHCYGGVYFPAAPDASVVGNHGAEYLIFQGNDFKYGAIGCCIGAGNITAIGNKIDHNRVNLVLIGGYNDAHGEWIGGGLNHGKDASLVMDKVKNGHVFSGVDMFDGGTWGIYIRKSRGLNMSGGVLGRMSVNCEGIYEGNSFDAAPNGGGINLIHGTTFNLHGATHTIDYAANGVQGNLLTHDNMHQEGSTHEGTGTWDEDILNNSPLDRFGWVKTDAGGENVAIGRPSDAFKSLGAGNATGAVKLKAPVDFGNTLVVLRVSIFSRVAARNHATFTIKGYALAASGGSWTSETVTIDGEKYTVRFGQEDGKPVVYIGELATIWTDCLVSIDECYVWSSALAQKQYWVSGWEVDVEPTAFAAVTKTVEDGPVESGAINTINREGKRYVESVVTDNPSAFDGWVETSVKQPTSPIRSQMFVDIVGKAWTRSTTTGDAGYTAWLALN